MIRLYTKEEWTQKEIGAKFNTWNTSVRRVLDRYNIPRKGVSEQRAEVKGNPFEDLSNPEVQYWLGYLAADGNVKPISKKSNLIRLNTNSDPEHLETYAKFLGHKGPRKDLNKKTGRYEYCVGFCSKQVNKFLHSIGITPAKSKSLEMKIALTAPFVLGYFDGNGTISAPRITISTGSEAFSKQLREFISYNFGKFPSVYKHKDSWCYVITPGNYLSEYFMDCLYESSPIYMPRKRKKYNHLYKDCSHTGQPV